MFGKIKTCCFSGAGFGLAVACVENSMAARQIISLHMTPPLELMVRAALLEIFLGASLGALLVPLSRLRRGGVWHALVLCGAWILLEAAVAPGTGPARVMSVVGPVAGLALFVVGRWLGRFGAWVAPALGCTVLAASILTPVIYLKSTIPRPVPRPALAPARAGAPDVVVIVLDTVRADHVSAYGYRLPTTPVFDALAGEGALFLDATAPATWSLPSHASLFTGLFPSVHGAHDEHRFLEAGPQTLGEAFAAAGYETLCFTANAWISEGLGLTRGFAWSDEAWRSGDGARGFIFIYRLLDALGVGSRDKGGDEVASNFEHWLRNRPEDARPAYVFLNFVEAHFPYHQLPDEYLARFTGQSRRELRQLSLRLFAAQFGSEPPDPAEVGETATAMYDAGVNYADQLLGRVMAALRQRGSLDDTVLVVLSDHGELLGEHGEFGHGISLYEPVLRVPLLLRYPPRLPAGTRVATPVSTVGVFPTVLDLAGLDEVGGLHASSLVPAVFGGPAGGPVMAERFASLIMATNREPEDPLLSPRYRYRSYRAGNRKIIKSSGASSRVFDLSADRGETRDLAALADPRVEALREEMRAWKAALALPELDAPIGASEGGRMDPAARERLRALGYIE
ncbi:MAG: sulfatase [Candidatus Binatia bacterium]